MISTTLSWHWQRLDLQQPAPNAASSSRSSIRRPAAAASGPSIRAPVCHASCITRWRGVSQSMRAQQGFRCPAAASCCVSRFLPSCSVALLHCSPQVPSRRKHELRKTFSRANIRRPTHHFFFFFYLSCPFPFTPSQTPTGHPSQHTIEANHDSEARHCPRRLSAVASSASDVA